MQATIDTTHNRWAPPLLFLVLAMALLLGGAAGYELKPSSAAAGTVRTIVVRADTGSASNSSGDECVFVNGHKGC